MKSFTRFVSVLLVLLVLVGIGVFSNSVFAQSSNEKPEKVTICHASGLDGTTKFETLTVGWASVYGPGGHFYEDGTPQAGHENDYLGPCEEDVVPVTFHVNANVEATCDDYTVSYGEWAEGDGAENWEVTSVSGTGTFSWGADTTASGEVSVTWTNKDSGESHTESATWSVDKPECYEQCSETVREDGEWSDWELVPGDVSQLFRTRTVTIYDARDQSTVCNSFEDTAYMPRPTCQETEMVEKWTDWAYNPASGLEERIHTVTILDAIDHTTVCSVDEELETRDVEKCSKLSEPVYGEWSDWVVNPVDLSQMMRSRSKTVYSAYDPAYVCSEDVVYEYVPRETCAATEKKFGPWSAWKFNKESGLEERFRSVTLLDAIDHKTVCGAEEQKQTRPFGDPPEQVTSGVESDGNTWGFVLGGLFLILGVIGLWVINKRK